MSAFFLYFNDGNPELAVKPEIIGPQLVHFPWVQWKSFQSKNLQIIYTENKSDTLNIFPDRNNKLLFIIHGYILESEGGITRIDKGESEYSIQNQMRKRYEQGGINACIGLNGQYNLLVWNTELEILEITNDRLGIYQLFYAPINAQRFVITTDIVTLKSIPGYKPKISQKGIFDLLYMGNAFEERTVLEGVTRLLPNASFQIKKNDLKLIQENRLPFTDKNWNAILPTLLDELEAKYIQSINRSFTKTDKVVFLQTGGKDSRLYSHFFKKSKITPQCITLGEKHHAEVFLAHEVSQTLGFPWKRVSLEDERSLQYSTEILELDSFSCRTLPFLWLNLLRPSIVKFDYITGTFLGDAIIGDDYVLTKIKIGKNENERTENFLNAWGRNSYYSDLDLNQLLMDKNNSYILEYKYDMANLLKRLHKEPYHQLLELGLRTNSRFKIGGALRTLSSAVPLRLPCLDNDLMDFGFSIPPVLFNNRLLINLFLVQRCQNLAAIPLDLNSKRGASLYRGIKQELKYKLWCNYVERIKLPFLKLTGYRSPLTTLCYVHAFSLKDNLIQEMLKESNTSVKHLEGILDVKLAQKLLEKPLPTIIDHIKPGNQLRTLLTVIEIAKTFNT